MLNTRFLTQEERFELVMECRSSGLSDYQWCQEKGIRSGTFYNWIARFRKKGYHNIPEPAGRISKHKAVKQEVVKLDVQPEVPADTTAFQSGRIKLLPAQDIPALTFKLEGLFMNEI